MKMEQSFDGLNRIEYARQSPSSLLALFRSNAGIITKYETFKRLSLEYPCASIIGDYRKISEGFWCMRLEYTFLKETEVYTSPSSTDAFYELEYFFNPLQSMEKTAGPHKFTFDSQAVLNSSAYQKTWKIARGSKFSSFKFVFTKEFLEENFYTDDALLQDTILQKIFNKQQPYYNREVYTEELILIRELERICNNNQTRLLQTISIKAKVLQLFCKFFEIQIHPAKDFEDETAFSAAIALMKQNVEESFPGLEKLAKISNVSIPTFKRKFKTLFLNTPEKYYRHLQMEKAEQMLRKKGMTVREVAGYLGYVNPKNFTECFRKLKGYSPSSVKEVAQQ